MHMARLGFVWKQGAFSLEIDRVIRGLLPENYQAWCQVRSFCLRLTESAKWGSADYSRLEQQKFLVALNLAVGQGTP